MLDLATALAVGGDCFADIATARERSAVFGKVRAHLEKESAALLANEDSDFTPPCSRSSTTGATELVDLSQRSSGPTTPITTLPTATSM